MHRITIKIINKNRTRMYGYSIGILPSANSTFDAASDAQNSITIFNMVQFTMVMLIMRCGWNPLVCLNGYLNWTISTISCSWISSCGRCKIKKFNYRRNWLPLFYIYSSSLYVISNDVDGGISAPWNSFYICYA